MEPQTGFLSLAEELLCYILSFLPYRDILRCTSICRTLRQTYLSFSELQYIVETSGQQLLVIPNTDDSIPISERLQRLRDEAHAWFKVDTHPFLKLVPITWAPLSRENIVAGGHFCSWDPIGDTAMILPVHPKPSQQSIRRNWLPGTLCSVPHLRNLDVFMDPAQNLIAVAYAADHRTVYINLGALDGDGVHPQAAGERLVLSDNSRSATGNAKLKGFGRHIALSRLSNDENQNSVWQLQIWDWKYSTTSSVSFGLKELKELMVDSEFRASSAVQYPTDPAQLNFVSSGTIDCWIFFDLDEMAAAMPIPWEHWGPSNTRIFQRPSRSTIHGNRVLQRLYVGTGSSQFILQLLDFSPLAVTNGRGLGRVVKEPSTTYAIVDRFGTRGESLTTSLPYVQVVFSDRKFDRVHSQLREMWIDKDRIYMLSKSLRYPRDRLEVIDVKPDLRSAVVSTVDD
ncbi:uncharacterized protein F5147DRAFT_653298 [Suillus discolor]|uniref:F-box domain-containing protein n=1 Tax=Suillus discolor TaxID=1912936 RepID=A0A9P7F6S3_9AGAM|nr:uncharacterized protein F5147DRAFT_653298 [Suillus discolor]KAG2107423.1 hypothetical protein F5147DRAFT_653298 [Suillus discolor]